MTAEIGLTERELAERPATPEGALRLALDVFIENKLALAAVVTFVVIVLFCFAGPLVYRTDQVHTNIGQTTQAPGAHHLLGTDDVGYDQLGRLMVGGQTSLEVALGATILSMFVGVIMGAIAGYHGGWIDTIVSRITEIVMAFPILLFIIALASTIGGRLDNVTFGFLGKGVVTLVLVLGFFGWFYPARIVRAQVLSLREKEFVEAARMVGASDARIVRSHLLPHLVAPVIVLATIGVAQNILAEAGLSFLGIGIKEPTPSWGYLLSLAPQYYLTQPWLMVWPGAAILVTTLSFNLLGDGLRDAFDPRATR